MTDPIILATSPSLKKPSRRAMRGHRTRVERDAAFGIRYENIPIPDQEFVLIGDEWVKSAAENPPTEETHPWIPVLSRREWAAVCQAYEYISTGKKILADFRDQLIKTCTLPDGSILAPIRAPGLWPQPIREEWWEYSRVVFRAQKGSNIALERHKAEVVGWSDIGVMIGIDAYRDIPLNWQRYGSEEVIRQASFIVELLAQGMLKKHFGRLYIRRSPGRNPPISLMLPTLSPILGIRSGLKISSQRPRIGNLEGLVTLGDLKRSAWSEREEQEPETEEVL